MEEFQIFWERHSWLVLSLAVLAVFALVKAGRERKAREKSQQ